MRNRTSTRLTHKEILRAKADKNKILYMYDGGGLQLTIKKNGSKLWEILYTSPITKKRRRTSIGNFPDVSLKDARDVLSQYKQLIAKNIDPIDHKRLKVGLTSKGKMSNQNYFNNIIDSWLELKKVDLADRTYKKRKQQFDNYVKPYFKNMDINSIKHPQIVKVLEEKAKSFLETAY